jgi:hypothetical protein
MVKIWSWRFLASIGVVAVMGACSSGSPPESHSFERFCSDREADPSRTCIVSMSLLFLEPEFFQGRRIVTSGVLSNRDGHWALFPDQTQAEVGFLAVSIPISDSGCNDSLVAMSSDRNESILAELIGEVGPTRGSGKFRLAGMPSLEFTRIEKLTTYLDGRVLRTFSCVATGL